MSNMFFGAQPRMFAIASQLRISLTPAEKKFWEYINKSQTGYRFKCQHPIGAYVVDFYSHFLKLIIEIDGSIHLLEDVAQKDRFREEDLKNWGLSIIRFTNDEVLYDERRTIQKLHNAILAIEKQRGLKIYFDEVQVPFRGFRVSSPFRGFRVSSPL